MYFKKIECFLAENGALRAGVRLTPRQVRQIRNIITEKNLPAPLHFHVALFKENKGIFARLLLLKRLPQYDVIRVENMLLIINVHQEIQQ